MRLVRIPYEVSRTPIDRGPNRVGSVLEAKDFEPPTEDAVFVFVDWERDGCLVTWRIP